MQSGRGLEVLRLTAEKMFKDYRNMKRELSVLKFQLQQFEGISEEDMIVSMQFAHPDGSDRVQTSGVSDKTASTAVNYKKAVHRENDEWFDFLWNRCRGITEEISFFEHSVQELEGIPDGLVMDLVNGGITWESMEKKYCVSHTMIAKYRKSAMKQLNEIYRLRDLQTESFILG